MFEEKEFFKLIAENKITDAKKYVMDAVPDYLYKYYSFSNEGNTKLDIKKLETLKNNSNWFDFSKNQNDPLDMRMGYVGIDEYPDATEAHYELANSLRKKLLDDYILCSFIDTNEYNLPMWFAYANNHRGYCIKYKVFNKKCFWKILYEENRFNVTHALCNLAEEVRKDSCGEKSETKDLYTYVTLLMLNTKQKSWEHEKEYRLIFSEEKQGARNIENFRTGIIIDSVYIGLDCSSENEEKIKEICKNTLKCNCYKAYTSQKSILDFKKL